MVPNHPQQKRAERKVSEIPVVPGLCTSKAAAVPGIHADASRAGAVRANACTEVHARHATVRDIVHAGQNHRRRRRVSYVEPDRSTIRSITGRVVPGCGGRPPDTGQWELGDGGTDTWAPATDASASTAFVPRPRRLIGSASVSYLARQKMLGKSENRASEATFLCAGNAIVEWQGIAWP